MVEEGIISNIKVVGKLDPVHLYLGQILGGAIFSLAVVAFFARKSRQEGVQTAVLVSSLLGEIALVQCTVLDYFKTAGDPQRIADQAIRLLGLGGGLWILGNFIAVLRADSFGGSSVGMKSAITKHLLVDIVCHTGISFFLYGYPDVALSYFSMKNFRPDGIHALLVRAGGAMIFASVINAFQALSFLEEKDKRVHFLSRLANYGAGIPVVFLYQWRYQLATTNSFIIALTMNLVLMGNALVAYFGPFSLPKSKGN